MCAKPFPNFGSLHSPPVPLPNRNARLPARTVFAARIVLFGAGPGPGYGDQTFGKTEIYVIVFLISQTQPPWAAGEDGMDERSRGHTTKFTRDARTRRMLDRLREGWGYHDVAREEGLSDRRVRQIVAGHVKRSEPVDADAHAALQIERLSFAIRVAGEKLATGDIRAIAPFIKAIDRLDHYQRLAPKAAPRRSQAADALVVKALVDRLRREVQSEAAPPAGSNPAAAPEPALEAQPSPPPIEPESPPAAAAPSLAAAEPAPPLAGPDSPLDVAPPPVPLAEPSPPLGGPEDPLEVAAPPVPLAEPSPPLAGPDGPLDVAAPPAVAVQCAPPAPAPAAAPVARPNMSNFAFSNFSPFFWR